MRKSGLDSATLALHKLSTRERVKVLSRLKEFMVRGTKGGFYAGELPSCPSQNVHQLSDVTDHS